MRTILNLIVLIFAISCIPTNKNEKQTTFDTFKTGIKTIADNLILEKQFLKIAPIVVVSKTEPLVGQAQEKTMEKFDLNKYMDFNLDTSFYSTRIYEQVYEYKEKKIQISSNNTKFWIEELQEGSNIYSLKSYYKENNSLARETKYYKIGRNRLELFEYAHYYDKEGNMIDEPSGLHKEYKVSWDDVIKKIKKEYNIDMFNPDEDLHIGWLATSRFEEKPVYEVHFLRIDKEKEVRFTFIHLPEEPEPPTFVIEVGIEITIIIDAKTGKILHYNESDYQTR